MINSTESDGRTPFDNGTTDTMLQSTTPSTGHSCTIIGHDYEIAPSVICVLCFILGTVYCFFGYRFFKATMFLTGFIFGALITYVICLEEHLLPLEGKIGVTLTAGVLCGLITMLVQYIGLFTVGFHFGLLLAIASLVVVEQFIHPSTTWIPIGVMFIGGLILALLALYFQRSFVILGTSLFGAALMMFGLDYFIERYILMAYIWDRVKANRSEAICWFSWLILGLWPAVFLVGSVVQWRLTAKGFDHNKAMLLKKQRKVDLQRLRNKDRRDTQQSRYRHLYQVRRINGDVITQSCMQDMKRKMSPVPGTRVLSQTQTHSPELDSTTTTLTQVPS